MPFRLSAKTVKAQLRYDLIGKDSQRGITLSYGWLANQCGHCMLGYIPTHLIYLLLYYGFNLDSATWLSALIVSLIWTIFEYMNVRKPLKQQKEEGALFEPDWKNIIHDTVTDLGFFIFGALFAAIALGGSWILSIILLVHCLILYVASKKWYHTKIFQQAAEYPFQFRLSQWKWKMDEAYKTKVLAFLTDQGLGKHLLISGEYKTGKTSLAVAIANELSIQHDACKYTTAIKLFSSFVEPDPTEPQVPYHIWGWRKANCLVIDDINTGLSGAAELISPEIFLQHVQSGSYASENIKALKQLNVIWVLGDVSSVGVMTLQLNWKTMMHQLG
ncbi:MAG: ATP-binding protein, partial [Chitinophagaceae bacterium]|nr:ATP-binding protein [Chitinophagaceae bacterium]